MDGIGDICRSVRFHTAPVGQVPHVDEACLQLRATPNAAWESRKWAEPVLHEWDLDDVCADVLFIVSEFVANAVCHTHTPPMLRLLHDDRRLRVEVMDHAMDVDPDPLAVGVHALSGRGLRIVGELAGDWGSELVPGGKVVWAEIPVSAA
jgi:anti-sigma regulatory factor (Ser/Thr protein kinase)